jgi:hypothetical protein
MIVGACACPAEDTPWAPAPFPDVGSSGISAHAAARAASSRPISSSAPEQIASSSTI